MKSCLVRLAAVAVMTLICAAQSRADDVLDIDQLRLLADQRPLQFDALRLSYEVFQDQAEFNAGSHIPHTARSLLVDADTGRFLMDETMDLDISGYDMEPQVVTRTFDGEVQSAFIPDQMIGLVTANAESDGLAESAIYKLMMLAEPSPDGLGIDDGSLQSLLSHGVVRDQLEPVADAQCHVVDAYLNDIRYAAVWLDVERDLMPMKSVTYKLDGAVASTVTVDSVAFLDDQGVWLPTSWLTEFQAYGETLRTYTLLDQESFELNPPVADEHFQPQFPPGAVVSDQISGETYRIDESGQIGEILYVRQNDEWIKADSTDAPAAYDLSISPTIFDSVADLVAYAKRQAAQTAERRRHEARPPIVQTNLAPPQTDLIPRSTTLSQNAAPRPYRPSDASQKRLAPPPLPPVLAVSTGGRPSWDWLVWLIVIAAVLTALRIVWRRQAKARLALLCVVGLLIAAIAVWRIRFIPDPVINLPDPRPVAAALSSPPASSLDYVLADNEIIRCIPVPDPAKRYELLEKLGLERHQDNDSIRALTVLWDGAPHFRSALIGFGASPRSLLQVLTDSLKIPLYRLEGVDVAQEISLPGDWIIRADADLDECMTCVHTIVQRSGYPDFRVVRTKRPRRSYVIQGVPQTPAQPIQILPPCPHSPDPHVQTGSLEMFESILSAAIQQPVAFESKPPDFKLSWCDRFPIYLALNRSVTDQMIADLFNEISAALNVTVASSEVEILAWRLELNN